MGNDIYKKFMIQFNTKNGTVRLFADNEKEIMAIFQKHKDELRLGYFDIFKIKNVGFIDDLKERIVWQNI